MAVEHLARITYATLPWKNGRGETDEIFLSPPGASRDDFEVRISSAPIIEDGAFSSFPGAERVITLIEGEELELDFESSTHRLLPLAPFRFDTGLAPIGRPVKGPVRVFNVMASRKRWRHVAQDVLAGPGEHIIPADDLVVVFAASGTWSLTPAAQASLHLAPRDTVLLSVEEPAFLAAQNGREARAVILRMRSMAI
ncbi:HutD family protein [Labrys sp. KNU-23]|uniref:HutD/Ves family protein n=1 Tax=Labrys sp. KNU-23 TaxID=2789216 RepID=UPI0011EDADC2|nr:HutD family protein [Labrys sp. KNU-23]QEN86272.1 HutD family protein [Labrys sp. KNU-23]